MVTTTGYPPKNPKGARPMKDPQADMLTWKPPKASNPRRKFNSKKYTKEFKKQFGKFS